MDPRPNGAFGDPESDRDLRVAQPADGRQDEHIPIGVGQFEECLEQPRTLQFRLESVQDFVITKVGIDR